MYSSNLRTPIIRKKNEEEATYDDPMQMKEKSNTSKYLKYRQNTQ